MTTTYFVFIVRMVRIARIKEVELCVINFILSNTGLKIGAVSCDEAGCFVDDVTQLWRRIDDTDCRHLIRLELVLGIVFRYWWHFDGLRACHKAKST